MKAKLFCLLLSIGISAVSFSQANATTSFCGGGGSYNATANLGSGVTFSWSICGSGMDAKIVAPTTGWVGLGWGSVGAMDGFQAQVPGTPTLQDVFSTDGFFNPPTVDTIQNISGIGGSQSATSTTITFSRLLHTADLSADIDLNAVLTTLFFFFNSSSDEFQNKFTTSGSADVNLALGIAATPLPAALPLFATGLGALGLLGWRRKRKAAALAA